MSPINRHSAGWFISFSFLACALCMRANERGTASVRSGLQAGDKIASIFEPLNVTGPFQGERHCLVCENGLNPVAMIFARQVSEPLVKLLVELDAATGKNKAQQMGSFVVLLNDEADQPEKLRELSRQHKLKHIILSVDDPQGPEGFGVTREADVTVMLYRDFEVRANHAFGMGELSPAGVKAVVADLPKILAEKQELRNGNR